MFGIIKTINVFNEVYLKKSFEFIKFKKQTRIYNIVKNKDKYSSIVSEIILKELLAKYNVDYYKTSIFYNCFGKPYINNNICFNLSHSGDYVVGVISDKLIGIDIQKLGNFSEGSARWFCSDEEIDFIFSNEELARVRYFEFFAIKESLIKLLGVNSYYLKNIRISFINGNYFIHELIEISTFKFDNCVGAICFLKS